MGACLLMVGKDGEAELFCRTPNWLGTHMGWLVRERSTFGELVRLMAWIIFECGLRRRLLST